MIIIFYKNPYWVAISQHNNMKSIVVLTALAALCSGHIIRDTPVDNSHYVEGVSRYVWMPDAEGNSVLVDLDEPVDEEVLNAARNGANNQYWLFTRSNRHNAQVITHNNVNSIRNSNYNGNRPLKVIVHGWNNNGNTEMNPLITRAFLDVMDCNVIVVDWRAAANSAYSTAADAVPSVGQHLGDFLTWLIRNGGGNWNQVHLVGFSLGAHVVGNAGRRVGNQPARITGLDPAGYRWHNNANRLAAGNGRYVEAIHTDGHGLGIMNPSGHADFYPNGGKNFQPGCWTSYCSHGRATELFAATVRHNHLIGRQCPNIWEAELGTCNGASLHMGNALLNKRGNGLYALRTGSSAPF
ncbi:pancreatic lipase-related protein 2-like [Spodoptera litura]|uniref:Pancreatic lipase-related protein 2-like n=1 Tax=Spodoptera litura TaxID=69820 RepID=A0A9J7E646_SPOLT|nr:pancreatic lipase-related protein 2-like [Spodoptera litura]